MAPKTPAKRPPRSPLCLPREAKRLVDLVDNAIHEFEGNVDHLEGAIGMLFIGRHVGWRPLLLVHNKRTIRNFEKILGDIDIRKFFPEDTPRSERSQAYKVARALGKFWKAVSGEVPIEGRREIGRSI